MFFILTLLGLFHGKPSQEARDLDEYLLKRYLQLREEEEEEEEEEVEVEEEEEEAMEEWW